MENLHITAPVAPAAVTKSTPAEVAAEGTDQPWTAAYQAAVKQHAKSAKTVAAQGSDSNEPAVASDKAAPAADDATEAAADAALAASLAGMPLPLVPPAIAAQSSVTTTPSLQGDAQRAGAASRTGTVKGDTAGVAELRASTRYETGAAHGAAEATAGANRAHAALDIAANARDAHDADATARSDALNRAIDLAAGREGNSRETAAQPAVQFTVAQALPAPTPTAASQAASPQINARVDSAAWGAELGQKIVWMAGEKQHVAEMRLNPPDLGPLDIKLVIGDKETTAVFTSPHSAVREAIESALPRLREVLAESGIALGNASVTADTPRDGSAFAASQEQARRGTGGGRMPAPVPASSQPVESGLTLRNRLVDLFA